MTKTLLTTICCLAALVALSARFSPAARAQGPEDDFTSWLSKYEAYDILERVLAEGDATPENVLERATAFLKLRRPDQAIKVLASTPPFEDQDLEKQRLWTMGRAQRMAGRLDRAVFHFSQAASLYQEDEALAERFETEPDVRSIFKDVWRIWLWRFMSGRGDTAAQGLRAVMSQSASQALRVWPSDPFWTRSGSLLESMEDGSLKTPVPNLESWNWISVADKERVRIAKGFAAAGLSQWTLAAELFDSLPQPAASRFWNGMVDYMRTGRSAGDLGPLETAGVVKAEAFLKGFLQGYAVLEADGWLLQEPEIPSWKEFQADLLRLKPSEAVEVINKELDSSLISPRTYKALNQLGYIFALLGDDLELAEGFWHDLDKTSLPLTLKFTGLMLWDESPGDFLGPAREGMTEFRLLDALTHASGLAEPDAVTAPFWLQVEQDNLEKALETWPMDLLLVFADWRRRFEKAPAEDLAKRLAYLFPETSQGIDALIYLSKRAGARGDLYASQKYLRMVPGSRLSNEHRMDYLHSRAALEIEMGQDEKALESYAELLNLDSRRLPPDKKLNLALLAQQKGRLDLTKRLLDELWNDKEELDPAQQAEVLFWQGETAQIENKPEKALEYYMQLAWKYPEQNIWAVTAMYRASLLYEQLGRYQTAAKLLKAVVRNSSRESQKKAAQDRLQAIEDMGGGRRAQNGKAQAPEYPF
jgi:tetratricopeptide (TPR) repeat protein